MYATRAERGILATNPVRAGGLLFTVPLRLALLDTPSSPATAALPWAARLALRLLTEAADPASPWAPWLRVLPPSVPSAYGGGPAAACLARAAALLPCPAAAEAVTAPGAAVAAEWAAVCDAGLAPPGADGAAWAWARGVVQSRTFGLPVGGGGGGGHDTSASSPSPTILRALVPLADMANHAGEEAALLLSGPTAPTETASWELLPPLAAAAAAAAAQPGNEASGGSGRASAGWAFGVRAAADLGVNAEVAWDYGAGRPNADFLASYAFVPPRNPHESVALWRSVREAVEWVGGGGGALLAAAEAAAEAASTPDDVAGAAHPEAAVRADAARLRLWAGGRADGRAVAALTSALGGDAGAAAGAIAGRAAHLLAACAARGGVPLLPALRELGRAAAAAEAAQAGSDDECGGASCGEPATVWTALQRRYGALAPALRTVPGLAAVAAEEPAARGGGAEGAGMPPPPPPLSAPPGASRAVWRRARLAVLQAAVYETMVLWDAVAGALGGGGEAARAAVGAGVEREGE